MTDAQKGLYAALQGHAAGGRYPFHMPGHKGNKACLPDDLLPMDVTELPGLDILSRAQGPIAETQCRYAQIYGAAESFLLVNGATAGVAAALCAACREGETVVMARNSHRSAYGALVLSGARPIYVYPPVLPLGFAGAVTPLAVAAALERSQGAAAVFVTSPTYEGVVSDIAGIAVVCRKYGALLIVDESHGAHFPYHGAFPRGALFWGADLVVHSLHKTLPVLGQSALLHVKGPRADRERIALYLSILQTSSPSYMLMGVMDAFAASDQVGSFSAYVDRLRRVRERLGQCRRLRLWQPAPGEAFDFDIGKLILYTDIVDGKGLWDDFAGQGLDLEMHGQRHVLAMTSPADTPEGFDRLEVAAVAIDRRLITKDTNLPPPALFDAAEALMVCTPREAVHRPWERVPLMDAVNRVSAQFVTPYPPGIPLLVPGEAVTATAVEQMGRIQAAGGAILAGEDGWMSVLI